MTLQYLEVAKMKIQHKKLRRIVREVEGEPRECSEFTNNREKSFNHGNYQPCKMLLLVLVK